MKNDDLSFMNELEAATRLKPSGASTLFLLVVTGLFVFLIGWAAIAEVDERTRGTGQVMPSSDMQVVQSLEGGIVTEVLVHEGDLVKKGQTLMRIDDVLFASEQGGIEAKMLSLRARQARLTAEAKGTEFQMPAEITEKVPEIASNEFKLYKSRQQELATKLDIVEDEIDEIQSNLGEVRATIGKLANSRTLLQQELDIATRLVKQNAMPAVEKIRLEREMTGIRGELNATVQAREALEARLSAAKKKIDEKKGAFRSQALGELNEVETEIAGIRERLRSVEDRVRRTELKAPLDGIVQRINVKTIGGVVEPAQKLVEIVPAHDDLMIRARVKPSDIAFLEPGQDVRVNITAYDTQIYGSLHGTLERISADAVEDVDGKIYFEIDVRTAKNHLGTDDAPLPIVPGMVAETEVITGKRTILTYLMKPFLRAKARAFSER